MKKTYTKSPSACNFTIHSVKLAKSETNPFQVKWKRGDVKGMTERAIPGDDNIVTFEKKFQCPCVVYIDKKTHERRPKHLSVSVYVIKGDKSKIFGKVTVDIARFYKVELPELCELELESPHSLKSMITISFSTTPTGAASTIAAGMMTEMSLNSLSEVMNTQIEQREDWDVSEAVSAADKERIEKFFIKRDQENEERRLAQFRRAGKAPSKPTLRFTPPELPPDSEPVIDRTGDLASFLGRGANPRKRTPKKDTAKERRAFRASLPCLSDQTEIIEPEKDAGNVPGMPLMKSVLGKSWSVSPVQCATCPNAVGAVIASFLQTNVFDVQKTNSETFESLVKEWFTEFEDASLVESETTRDKIVVLMFLVRCLTGMSEGDSKRRMNIAEQLKTSLKATLDAYISDFIVRFSALASEIMRQKVAPDVAAEKMNKEIGAILKEQNFPEKLSEVVRKELIRKIDAFLVNVLCNSQMSCTFGNAGQWNTLITIMESDKEIPLKLFRQAVGVLMLGQPLCGDPSLAKEFCPDLAPEVVLYLLVNEQPDDAMPIPNDTKLFQDHYSLDIDAGYGIVTAQFESDLEPALASLSCDWKSCQFDKVALSEFEFLQKFFK